MYNVNNVLNRIHVCSGAIQPATACTQMAMSVCASRWLHATALLHAHVATCILWLNADVHVHYTDVLALNIHVDMYVAHAACTCNILDAYTHVTFY